MTSRIEWNTYEVSICMADRLVGGIPAVVEFEDRAAIYEKWLRGQQVENDPQFADPLAEVLAADEDMPVLTAEETEPLMTFRADDNGLYVEARQVKAMLKEAAQRLGYIKTRRGARQVVQHDLHVRAPDGSQKLYLDRAAPDGRDSRPISVVTPQGPRTAIKRFDYVNQPEIVFQIRCLSGGIGDGILGEDELATMLELGGDLGLGADRSQGEGTFTVTSFKKI